MKDRTIPSVKVRAKKEPIKIPLKMTLFCFEKYRYNEVLKQKKFEKSWIVTATKYKVEALMWLLKNSFGCQQSEKGTLCFENLAQRI